MIIRYKITAAFACLIAFSAPINAACFPFFCGTKKSKEKSKYYPTPSFQGITPSASPGTIRTRANQEIGEIKRAGGIGDENTDLAGQRAVFYLRQLKRLSSKKAKKVSQKVAEECDFEIAQLRGMRKQYSPKRDQFPPPFILPPAAQSN
jgi:hypothetical protein